MKNILPALDEDPGVPPQFKRVYPLMVHGLLLAGMLRLIEVPEGGTIVDPAQEKKLHRKLWAATRLAQKG